MQGNYNIGDQQGQVDNNSVAVAGMDALPAIRDRSTSVAELSQNSSAVRSSAVA